MEQRPALAITLRFQPRTPTGVQQPDLTIPLGEVLQPVEPFGRSDWRDVRAGDWVVWTRGPEEGAIDVIDTIELAVASPPQPSFTITSVGEWEGDGNSSQVVKEASPLHHYT